MEYWSEVCVITPKDESFEKLEHTKNLSTLHVLRSLENLVIHCVYEFHLFWYLSACINFVRRNLKEFFSLVHNHNLKILVFQYSSMAPRLSGQTSIFGGIFSVSKSVRNWETKETTKNCNFVLKGSEQSNM